jgi:hypothetical protein
VNWTLTWILWIAAFVALEAVALLDKRRQDTFSEFMWRLFRVRDRRPTALTWVARAALVAFGVWLTGHLAFGWWSL